MKMGEEDGEGQPTQTVTFIQSILLNAYLKREKKSARILKTNNV
jgi:hypothetical protein